MAARADDLLHYYSFHLGKTIQLGVDTTSRQLPDTIGPLRPGKYLIRAATITARCWIRTGPFVAGTVLTALSHSDPATTGGVAVGDEFLLDTTSGVLSVIIHVRKDTNDRIAAICPAGSAQLVITHTGE